MRTMIALLVAASASLACGSDGGLSAAEYRAEGNRLCDQGLAEALKVPEPKFPEELADYLARILRISERVDRELGALEPPPERARLHRRIVRTNARGERLTRRLVRRVRRAAEPAGAALREFRKLAPEIKRSERLYRRAGWDECVDGFIPTESDST